MIIAIAGQKGGTGKSTITICLAVGLQRREHSVIVIDADAQGTATTWRDIATEMDALVLRVNLGETELRWPWARPFPSLRRPPCLNDERAMTVPSPGTNER